MVFFPYNARAGVSTAPTVFINNSRVEKPCDWRFGQKFNRDIEQPKPA